MDDTQFKQIRSILKKLKEARREMNECIGTLGQDRQYGMIEMAEESLIDAIDCLKDIDEE